MTPTPPAQPTPGVPAATMMMCPVTSVAVDDTCIFVLRGSEVTVVNKSNMQVASTQMLPTTQPGTVGAGPATQACPHVMVPSPGMVGAGATMVCPSSSAAVDALALYVLQGNQLMRINKQTLQVMNSTTLPAAQMTMPAAPGAGPGMDMQPNAGMQPGVNAQPGMVGAGPGMVCPMGALDVDATSVYVVHGDQLLVFNKQNLQLTRTVNLPPMQAMTMPAAPGAGSGTAHPF